jgi:hypothetical protein
VNELETTLYNSNYHNCEHIVLSAMMRELNVNLDLFWTQSILHFQDTNEEGFLTPYYRSILEDLKEIGVNYEIVKETNLSKFIERMKAQIVESPICLYTDIFELPYSIHYKQLHEMHAIEIYQYNKGKWLIKDHYYKYQGTIDTAQLENSIQSLINNGLKGDLSFLFLRRLDTNFCYLDPYEVIRRNLEMNKTGNKELVFGLKAIDYFLKSFEINIQRENANALENQYSELKELANSRYHLSQYFKFRNVEDLGDLSWEASQNWLVAANMVLRLIVSAEIGNMKPRILKRMKIVYESEQRLLNCMGRHLENKELNRSVF